MPTHTSLKGVSNISSSLLNQQLEANLVSFFDWGTLNIGGFANVDIPNSGTFGGTPYRLSLVKDPRYTDGQVWQGFRQNWVWESGLSHSSQPISISGIYVNNTFRPLGSGYIIDFPRGRVIFDTAISATGTVHLAYSYKYINYISTDDIPWFKEVQYNSLRIDDASFNLVGSGNWAIFAENRIQLPAVIVEAVPRRRFKGYELGGGQYCYQDVQFHILAETPWDRKQIIDIISYQNEKTIYLYDKNVLKSQNMFPIRYDGYLNNNPRTYPNLVEGSGFWKEMVFKDMGVIGNPINAPLYSATVKMTAEVIMGEL